MGGININAITKLLEVVGIEVNEKNIIKCTTFIHSAIKSSNETIQNHRDDINNLNNGD